MKTWLRERQDIGIKAVVASFAGHGEFHDRWDGRLGDFEFQMRTLRVAASLGMELRQRLFLTNSTIPLMDELIKKLDALPGHVDDRCVYPLFYSGLARRLEDERVTRETFDGLPERIRKLYRSDWKNWRSEQEWIDIVRREDETPEQVTLDLELTDSNMDRVESMSCDEIVAELESATRSTQAAIHHAWNCVKSTAALSIPVSTCSGRDMIENGSTCILEKPGSRGPGAEPPQASRAVTSPL